MTLEELENLFEQIKELVDLSAANNISLARMGGIQALLELMIAHENDEVRKLSGQVFNSVTGNNLNVQIFAAKTGAVNLAA